MNFESYLKYKNSGVEWIDRIPEEWEMTKLLNRIFISTGAISNKEIKEQKILFHYSIPNLDAFSDGVEEETDTIESNKYLLDGDEVLISKLNPRKSRIIICKKHNIPTICSTEFVPLKVRDIKKEFLLYLLTSERIRQFLDSRTESVTKSHKRVDPHLIPRITAPVPSLEDQNQIVTFLESETSRINQTLKKYQELVDILKEKRIALISHVVTKGLNPNVKMKDSGVEWIGKIPEHWEVKRTKFASHISKEKVGSKPDDIRYLAMENIESWTGKLIEDINIELVESAVNVFYKGDILLGKIRPYLAKVLLVDFDGVCTTELVVLHETGQFKNNYLFYLMLSHGYIDTLNAMSYGVKMPRASPEQIGDKFMPIPPICEQEQIIQHLKQQTRLIDQLIEKIQNQIGLLNEYKTSLISHVVTGKIDVRGEVKCQVPKNIL